MKIAIVGSRNFHDYELLDKTIKNNIDIDDIDYIVSGGAQGADRLGERFATINKIKKAYIILNGINMENKQDF